METATANPIRLSASTIDLTRGTVSNGNGAPIALRPQALAVLKLLAAKPSAVVTKDELMAAVWPGIAVTDDSLVQCVTEIRKALGDDGHAVIKTVPKRGYVFEPRPQRAQASSRWQWRFFIAALAAFVAMAGFYWYPKPAPVPEHVPSIAVLPFDNMSGDASLAYLGDGIAEDIVTILSRFPNLSVVARNSSFAYKGKPVDVRKLGSELGVDFVLEGSVRKDKNTLRIIAQLVDARDGRHVWAERFDKTGTDPYALHDDVTAKIVGTIAGNSGQIKQADYRRAWGKDTASLEEYDYFLRSHDYLMRETKSDYERGAAILREGLSKFPNSNLLKIKLGLFHYFNAFGYYSDDPQADYRRSGELGREVLAAGPLTPQVARLAHWLMAYVYMQEKDFGQALAEADKAVALAPYDASLAGFLATVPIMSGKPDQGLAWTEKAIALDAADRPWFYYRLGLAYSLKGENEKSIEALKQSHQMVDMVLLMAIGKLRLGRLDEAQAEYKRALTIDPSFTQAKWREGYFYSDPSVVEGQIANLAKLGLPEH